MLKFNENTEFQPELKRSKKILKIIELLDGFSISEASGILDSIKIVLHDSHLVDSNSQNLLKVLKEAWEPLLEED